MKNGKLKEAFEALQKGKKVWYLNHKRGRELSLSVSGVLLLGEEESFPVEYSDLIEKRFVIEED